MTNGMAAPFYKVLLSSSSPPSACIEYVTSKSTLVHQAQNDRDQEDVLKLHVMAVILQHPSHALPKPPPQSFYSPRTSSSPRDTTPATTTTNNNNNQ